MNAPNFDERHWAEVIKRADWYNEFIPFVRQAYTQLAEGSPERDEFHKTIRHFFENKLAAGEVALAADGPDLDAQRMPIDTLVIHHTSHTPGYCLSYMEATQLLNIYAPYYMNPTVKEERGLKGRAIWSGHFRGGKQTFLCYHWLMRMDGRFERLLEDKNLAWHAGNWQINRRSVAICLDNDYDNAEPTDKLLRQLAAHIRRYYPEIKNIIGHCEARQGTSCPGANFLSVWKPKLLSYIQES